MNKSKQDAMAFFVLGVIVVTVMMLFLLITK
jgi:hypothetical protein